jgi:ribosome-associated protein
MVDSIHVRPGVLVPEEAMDFHAVRAGGPGGQNVNKVSSKVELRVSLDGIVGLDSDARERLRALCSGPRRAAGSGRLDAEGRLVVTSQLTRDQRKNLDDARDKVRVIVARALVRPRKRRATRPTRASVERRLSDKRHRSTKKADRRGDH